MNTSLQLDTGSWTFSQFPLGGASDPTPRAFHSLTVYPGNNMIIAFGGQTADYVPGENCGNADVEILVFAAGQWTVSSRGTTGTPPPCVWGHTSTYISRADDELVVFGGCTSVGSPTLACTAINSGVYTLRLQESGWEWYQPTVTGHTFKPRFLHAAAAYDDSVIVYGGQGDNNVVFTDILRFTRTAQGLVCTVLSDQSVVNGRSLAAFGSAAAISGSVFVSFGGSCNGCSSQTAFRHYDLSENRWYGEAMSGSRPPITVGATVVVFSTNTGPTQVQSRLHFVMA